MEVVQLFVLFVQLSVLLQKMRHVLAAGSAGSPIRLKIKAGGCLEHSGRQSRTPEAVAVQIAGRASPGATGKPVEATGFVAVMVLRHNVHRSKQQRINQL